jgi:hypothetical protein
MTDSPMRTKEEIRYLLTELNEVEIYIHDPCVRSHMDSFASALRWVLNEKTIIKKVLEDALK